MAEPSFSHRLRWYQFRLRSLLLLTTLLILMLVGWRIYVAPRVAYYRSLEFPELRFRSPDEIHVLRRHVAALKAEHDRIDQFRKAEIIGGDQFHLAGAAYRLASAQAELAWSQGHVRDAVRHTAEAAIYAEERVRLYDAAWQGAPSRTNRMIAERDLGELLEARANAHRALFRGIAVAEHAKVDVSGIEIDVTSAHASTYTKQVKSLADLLTLLRSESAPRDEE
jgi:hypothetical protein